jgi:hypothetical protein
MSPKDAEEEFEFLVNLLASDGVDPANPPLGSGGSQKGDASGAGPAIQRGPDGRLDLGQVKAFYERKKTGSRKEEGKGVTDSPQSSDHSPNRPGA